MTTRQFDFVVGPTTSTLPTITDVSQLDAGVVTIDLTAASQTIDSGKTLTHPNVNIAAAHTYTINGSMASQGAVTVAGTLLVNNQVDIGRKLTISTGGKVTVAAGKTLAIRG